MSAVLEHDDADERAWRNRPMSDYARMVFGLGKSLAAMHLPERGSQEALAHCDEKREQAIAHAQQVIDAPDDLADRLVNGAASDGFDWVNEDAE